jgi:hypothetical protein
MKRLTPVLAFAAGATAFGAVVLALVSLPAPLPAVPTVLAVPVGLGVGMAAMTAVYVGLGDDPSTRHFRGAFAAGALGVTLLGVLLAGLLAGATPRVAVAAAAGAGVLAAVGVLAVSR